MKRLQLDFSPYRPRQRRLAGTLAALAAGALIAVLLLQYRAISARIAQHEAAAQAARPPLTGTTAQPSEAQQRELTLALAAQRVLNLPWEPLLAALEQAQGGKVHLLALQPIPLRGELVLSGEAENFKALMDYLQQLRAQPVFAEVTLVNQRQVADDGQHSLAFTLAAEWKAGSP